MANLNEIHSTTTVDSPLDVIQNQAMAAPQGDSTPQEKPLQELPNTNVGTSENPPPLSSPRSAGVFAKNNSEVIDAIPDSASVHDIDAHAPIENQLFQQAEIGDFQELTNDIPTSPAASDVLNNDLDAALAKLIDQESGFSTDLVESVSIDPADDFPVDQTMLSASLDTQQSDLTPEANRNVPTTSDAPSVSLDAGSTGNGQHISFPAGDSKTSPWEAFYQSLVMANKKQKIQISSENAQYAVFEPNGEKPGITFFDQTGKPENLNGSPAEQLERHFAGYGIGDVFTTGVPISKKFEQNGKPPAAIQNAPSPNSEEKSPPAQLIVAPSVTEPEPIYREAAEPRFAAATPPHAFHGPSAALASALVGTAALPFNLMAALNDKVRDFRLAKRSAYDDAALGQPQDQKEQSTFDAPSTNHPLSEPTPALHERLSHKLNDYVAAIDRFHETPEMEEVSKALDKYSPENRNKALNDDPAVAKLVHQAVTANPALVKAIHSQAVDVETISEELDDTVFGKLQKEEAKQLQSSLAHAQEKTKALPFHEAFDSLKDKFSSAMSSIFEKLGALISKFTQSHQANASASAELS